MEGYTSLSFDGPVDMLSMARAINSSNFDASTPNCLDGGEEHYQPVNYASFLFPRVIDIKLNCNVSYRFDSVSG